MSDSTLVITPWFPSKQHPYAGVFVADTVAALSKAGPTPRVVHLQNVRPSSYTPPRWERWGEIEVFRIPVDTPAGTSREQMGKRQRDALLKHAGSLLAGAQVVHVHVGIPTGWAVTGALPEATRLVVTEHATYLVSELAHEVGRSMYRAVLDRAAWTLAVSEQEARLLRSTFPQHRGRVTSFGNPVRSTSLPQRPSPPTELNRWLYVGNFIERKGLRTLVRAFAAWRSLRPNRDVQLTLVGDGELKAQLVRDATDLGIGDLVHFPGPARPDQLATLLHHADVLVHLSALETFGLTVVEAAITGLPVISTASGGPQETLSEAAAEGLVALLSLPATEAKVVSAATALERTMAGADTSRIRRNLLSRYGEEEFGVRLRAVLDGGSASPALPTDTPVLLALANSPRGYERLNQLALLAHHGGVRLVVATDSPDATALDPRIEVLDFHEMTNHLPWHLPERMLVSDAPAWLIGRAGATFRYLEKLPGGALLSPGRLRRGLDRLARRHSRAARIVHDRFFFRFFYSYVDPWFTSRSWEARCVEAVHEFAVPSIAMLDVSARPIAWRIARQLPEVQVLGSPTSADLIEMSSRQGAPSSQDRKA